MKQLVHGEFLGWRDQDALLASQLFGLLYYFWSRCDANAILRKGASGDLTDLVARVMGHWRSVARRVPAQDCVHEPGLYRTESVIVYGRLLSHEPPYSRSAPHLASTPV